MKTKSNVQKTILKSLAILTSLVLLSYTLSAQEMWKQLLENTSSTLALALNSESTAATAAEKAAALSSYEATENDAEMELEAWMTDANYFAANSYMEKETEAPMALENWMTAENFGMEAAFSTETESSLELEDWMLNENNFEAKDKNNIVYRTNSFVYREIEEGQLQFEAWMFNSNHFKVN